MNLQQLKSVIQAANPDIGAERECDCPSHETVHGRPIRLADVLLAFSTKPISAAFRDDGRLMIQKGSEWLSAMDVPNKLFINWDLANDSLDNQSPETIEFLINLLVK